MGSSCLARPADGDEGQLMGDSLLEPLSKPDEKQGGVRSGEPRGLPGLVRAFPAFWAPGCCPHISASHWLSGAESSTLSPVGLLRAPHPAPRPGVSASLPPRSWCYCPEELGLSLPSAQAFPAGHLCSLAWLWPQAAPFEELLLRSCSELGRTFPRGEEERETQRERWSQFPGVTELGSSCTEMKTQKVSCFTQRPRTDAKWTTPPHCRSGCLQECAVSSWAHAREGPQHNVAETDHRH
ncbi:uncharacterized protein LOC110344852 [Heterocephalus glaber]|uniref:Uncharacterized protein LOC110344852 n=1 Tax=Heterocephalus glaber TaxID=10181 RepID=A0AAX6RGY3_HETGA|nr:uncharacterized protein LOC110344852 [Heterocephalus glaber]